MGNAARRPPGSFRKEVSTAAKCMVNRAGWGWPLALARSDQHLHPPMIKDEDPPCQGLGQRGQDREMNSVFCNLDVSRPNCLLSQPKMDPSGAADYIREDSLFSQRRPDKRGASVPLAIWSQNNRKGPRKGGKKKENPAQPAHSHERKEQCLNRWDG